jgi:hypothetical protein
VAKLPDATVFGGIGSPNSGRPIATYDTTGYARGASAIAGGISDLGRGLASASGDFSATLAHERQKDEKLETARARADFLTKKIELDTSLKDDQDYETLQERYNTKLNEIRAGSAGLISNPRTRELFDLTIADDVARAAQGANLHANKIWKDRTLADSNERLEAIRQAALKTNDPEERVKLIDSGNALISSLAEKNITSAATAAEVKKKWTADYAAGAISLLSPQERVAVLDGFQGALKKQESGGNPAKVNQLGYAGLYQFGAPRLAAMGVYTPGPGESLKGWSETPANAPGKWSGSFNIPGRPDIKTLKDFLANPSAQEEAFQIHTQKMDQEIQQNGFDKYIGKTIGGQVITREGLQAMMHLGGVGGARRTLESDGKDSPKDANGTSVLSYARFGSQSGLTRVASLLPEDTRNKLRVEAQNEVDRTTVKAAMAQSEVHDRAITDAAAGLAPLPARSTIEQDAALDEPRRNALLKQYDAAAGDVAKFNLALSKFRDPSAGGFNPFDKDDRDNTDKIYKVLGGDMPALQAVVDRTGIVPKAAVSSMRGSLASNDPARVAGAANIAVNLLAKNPTIFAGVDGGGELEDAAVKMAQYVDRFGMSADEAGRKIIEESTPEYKAKVKARVKNEDIGEIVKKKLSIDDMRSAFDTSWWPGSPQVEFTPEARQSAYSDYVELFRDSYQETGDVDVAKAQAAKQLKKVWGVSQISGKDVVMRFPPDLAPAMAGMEDPAGKIAAQATEAIKGVTGEEVPRDKIILSPLPGGQTARPYVAGQPAPYALSWFDKNGTLQMLNPGQAFVADPMALREKVSAGRQRQFNVAREAADLVDRDLSRAPFGVQP